MRSISSDMGVGQSVPAARARGDSCQALADELRSAGYTVCVIRGWNHLPAMHVAAPDVFLVDFDTIEQTGGIAGQHVSGHRLVTLLARQIARPPTAVVVMTDLDFAEVEHLARVGVQAFLSPRQPIASGLEMVRAAVRRRAARQALSDHACALVPVLSPAEHHSTPPPAHRTSALTLAHA